MNHDQGWMPLNWLLWPRVRPYVVLASVSSMVLNVALAMPAVYLLQLFDRVLASRSVETLAMLSLLAFGALGLGFCMDRVRAALLARAARVVEETLSAPALAATLADAARAHGDYEPSVLHDIARLRAFLAGPAIHALFDAPWLPLYLLLIYALHPMLGLAATASAATLFALGALTERLVRPGAEAATGSGRAAGRHADAMLRHAETIVGGGSMANAMCRWRRLHEQTLASQQRLGDTSSALAACGRLLRQGVQVAMPGLGAWLVVSGDASPGIMVAATVLIVRALQPVEHLIAGWKSVLDARAAWRRLVRQAIDSPAHRALQLPPARGELTFEGVSHGTGLGRGPIIRNVSMRLAPGECLGLIGPSASGKTTLLRLMLDLRRPALGSVRLDGAELAAWPQEQLACAVGYLPQDVELLDGTVAQNIARLADAHSDDAAAKVIDAAMRAGAHELILRLPQGYETHVAEAGLALSRGQRQRIALARALYGGPKLVVLDEPDAFLDDEGEQALFAAIAFLKQAHTTVVLVSHRPSLMRHADKLAVMRNGALDLFGPRDEVLARLAQGNVRRLRPADAGTDPMSQGAQA